MPPPSQLSLGVEGGGTKTDWVLLEADGKVRAEGQLHASNLKLSTDAQLTQLFSVLPREATHVGVFLAGCLMESDRTRLRRLVKAAWPHAGCVVGSDRESGFETALGRDDGIIVISGTGAVVQGRKDGRITKAGGWGHILGDRGGGYDMARHALRKVILRYDLQNTLTPLAEAILAELGLNELPHLVDWVNQADKMQVARLAPVIFRAAEAGDADMRILIDHRARDLAEFTLAVAQRLGMRSEVVEVVEVRLLGGLLTKEPSYAGMYQRYLNQMVPRANVALCIRSGAYGAAALAQAADPALLPESGESAIRLPVVPVEVEDAAELATAPTEQAHARAAEIDTLPARDLVALFIEEEDRVRAALLARADQLQAGVEVIAESLRAGGRLFYIGAGTSGRLGVLDASEMPPTFGTPPEMVQGIIAGGASALLKSTEAAEDSREAGALALLARGVGAKDVVCGIAASGRTPFVLGALEQAHVLGARTILLTCNPSRQPCPHAQVEIDLPTGPEIVTGSTRLKAGTATKVALNLLSTCAMILLGKVRGGAMVDLKPSNGKLRERAVRMVAKALHLSEAAARQKLVESKWNVRKSLG